MTEIRKATINDFDGVLPLLREFGNPYVQDKEWQRIFKMPWPIEGAFPGYIMIESNEVVGFLGLIFSEREIDGEKVKVINTTSWIVREEYRSKSIFMLVPLLKMKGAAITDYTPSREVFRLIDRAGFEAFETHYRLILPWVENWFSHDRVRVLQKAEEIVPHLDDYSLSIYKDHSFRHCRHILIKTDQGQCYILLTRMVRKRVPYFFTNIHYISDLDIFRQVIRAIRLRLCLVTGTAVLMVGERYLKDIPIFASIKKRLLFPMMYRSDKLNQEQIDTLYSESILLNI